MTTKIAANLERFVIAVNAHDRENPSPHSPARGIGLNVFDLERLGFEEGEEVLPGIFIEVDDGVSGNFRVICDGAGDHSVEEVEEVVHA